MCNRIDRNMAGDHCEQAWLHFLPVFGSKFALMWWRASEKIMSKLKSSIHFIISLTYWPLTHEWKCVNINAHYTVIIFSNIINPPEVGFLTAVSNGQVFMGDPAGPRKSRNKLHLFCIASYCSVTRDPYSGVFFSSLNKREVQQSWEVNFNCRPNQRYLPRSLKVNFPVLPSLVVTPT